MNLRAETMMEKGGMFGIFQESGPPRKDIPDHLISMKIFHGGYFEEQLDGGKKYTVPVVNKTGGTCYFQGLDPDKISWVEMNNIAYALGYREKPIAYHFKLPRTPARMGFIQIKSDGDAVEMINTMPKRKKEVVVYITGGGRRRYHEALTDFDRPVSEEWENPLNKLTMEEKDIACFEANVAARQLYNRMEEDLVEDVLPLSCIVGEPSNEPFNLDTDDEHEVEAQEDDNVGEKDDVAEQTEGTFAGLSDFISDFHFSGISSSQDLGDSGTRKRVKYNVRKPQQKTTCVRKELDDMRQKQKDDLHGRKEREDLNDLERLQTELKEKEASIGLNTEELNARNRETEKKKTSEEREKARIEVDERRKMEAAEKRASEALKLRRGITDNLEQKASLKRKGKQAAQNATKKSVYGKKKTEVRYNTRKRVNINSQSIDDEESEDADMSDGFRDPDYVLEEDEADDHDFAHYVDEPDANLEEFEEMGYHGYCSDEVAQSDDLGSLESSENEEDENQGSLKPTKIGGLKLPSYVRSTGIENPKFRVGLLFADVEQLREAVREYAIRNQLGIWFAKNTKKKVQVKCQWGCPFNMYASNVAKLDSVNLVIKTLTTDHNCSPIESSHFLTYKRVAQEIKERLLIDEEWSRKGIHKHIEETYKMDVPLRTVSRGKRAAKKMIEGHYIQQYNKLAAYRKEILRSNPGTTMEIVTEMDGAVCRFKRLYLCFQACKEGWINGCRPIIGLDGCHTKSHHPGQLLTAIGIDANNGIFPIAYALAEAENEETWTWFLQYLQHDVKIERDSSYTFITDKQKGLENAIRALFPNAEHRHCVRHLYNNFKQRYSAKNLKQLMWNAARSTSIPHFTKQMDAMRLLNNEAAAWFNNKCPSHWSRAFFKEETKCDILLNNLCESFNSCILPARDKPILAMFEWIRMSIMVRNANRKVACESRNDVVGPRIRKILDNIRKGCTSYRVHRASEYKYQVTGSSENGSQHAVDLGFRTCSCRKWQVSGIPCVHAICCIRFRKEDVAYYCNDYLMKSTYMQAYTPALNPIAGEQDWEHVHFPIAPPTFNKLPGRPKKKRISSQGETTGLEPPAPTESRLPRTDLVMTCKLCGKTGHNKRGCLANKTNIAAELGTRGEGTSASGSNTKEKMTTKAKRIPAPPKETRRIKDQIIRSKKGWKKMKTGETYVGDGARQPPTQNSQNPAARAASN